MLLLALLLALVTGCSDDDGGDTSVGDQPRTLEEFAAQDDRLTEITDPPANGPLIGTENGEEVRVNDTQTFCDGYGRVADYRDQIFNLLDRDERDLLTSYVEGTAPSAEEAAGDVQLGISGGMDLDMLPWTFVASSKQWIYDGLDLETIRERATVKNAELEGFDRAYAEIC